MQVVAFTNDNPEAYFKDTPCKFLFHVHGSMSSQLTVHVPRHHGRPSLLAFRRKCNRHHWCLPAHAGTIVEQATTESVPYRILRRTSVAEIELEIL